MKIAITGSSGLIGSCLVESLSRNHEVFGLDLKPGPYNTIVGDIQNFNLVERLVSNVDVVIHCAAQTSVVKSVEEPLFDAENNVIGTLNLLQAARRTSGLKRFIYFSSAAVYGFPERVPLDEDHPCKPISPYGVSKLTGEFYARIFHELYEVPTIIIRPFNVYGKNQDPNSHYSGVISRFIDRIKNGLPLIIYGDGSQTRDFINVRDVAEMILLFLEDPKAIGETFNCGTGAETSINELAKIMITLSGTDLGSKSVEGRLGDIQRSCADVKKTKKILGFKYKTNIEQGLHEFFGSYNNAKSVGHDFKAGKILR